MRQVALVVAVLAGGAIAVGAGLVWAAHSPLPDHHRDYRVAGLHAPVEISRDRWGVAHVHAKSEHDSGRDDFAARHVPAYRRIIDVADMADSRAVNSAGQSSHPASPHPADQTALWADGTYRTAAWTDEQVRAAATARQRLLPRQTGRAGKENGSEGERDARTPGEG